jgi:hypothetical protein
VPLSLAFDALRPIKGKTEFPLSDDAPLLLAALDLWLTDMHSNKGTVETLWNSRASFRLQQVVRNPARAHNRTYRKQKVAAHVKNPL